MISYKIGKINFYLKTIFCSYRFTIIELTLDKNKTEHYNKYFEISLTLFNLTFIIGAVKLLK